MRPETLVVSERGQITLPKRLRDRLAIGTGSALIVEERDGGLMLRPAAVTALRRYSDEEVAGWLRDDRVTASDRRRVLQRAKRAR